jgi:hypothetical protein
MDMSQIKDKLSLDGAIRVPRGVTQDSVGKVAKFIAEAKRGSFIAEAQLKESLMTGTLASSVAHLINLITIPQLPDTKERPVAKLAGTRQVSDFRPATLYSIFGTLEGPGVVKPDNTATGDGVGSAPRVPQGTPYPVATITGAESAYSKLNKRGLRVNWDFEDFINDTLGVLDGIPAELRQIALQTEWQEVGDALVGGSATALGAVTLPDGTAEPANAAVSAKSIMGAIQQLAKQKVHNSLIGTLSGYNVVVPVGSKVFVDYSIRMALGITAILPSSAGGAMTIGPDNSVLGNVEVIEHESVTGTNWYLLPKPGAYRRPVLDVLQLRGYEQPQLRYKDDGGDGFSFDTDSASLRLRMVTGAALWFSEAVVHSTGANAAV